ncbi:MAG: hypothetical protein ACI9SE_001645 [Neolewinella sp.]|jgi:hypothetical protein
MALFGERHLRRTLSELIARTNRSTTTLSSRDYVTRRLQVRSLLMSGLAVCFAATVDRPYDLDPR